MNKQPVFNVIAIGCISVLLFILGGSIVLSFTVTKKQYPDNPSVCGSRQLMMIMNPSNNIIRIGKKYESLQYPNANIDVFQSKALESNRNYLLSLPVGSRIVETFNLIEDDEQSHLLVFNHDKDVFEGDYCLVCAEYSQGNVFYARVVTGGNEKAMKSLLTSEFRAKRPKNPYFEDEKQIIEWKERDGFFINRNLIISQSNEAISTSSDNLLRKDKDGFIFFRIRETETGRYVGFTEQRMIDDPSQINFAVHIAANKLIRIYEKGKKIGSYDYCTIDDVFSIERKAGIIRYKRNDNVIYQSKEKNNKSLRAAVTIVGQGGGIYDAQASF